MKIDLHCHTHKIKDGDAPTREVSVSKFAEKIANADVKIVGITNHNSFDLQQYNELKKAVKDYCDVWPGVELDAHGDVKKKDKYARFHLIVISSPDEVIEFDQTIKTLLKDFNVNEDMLSLEEICSAFRNQKVLYIAHYMGKQPAISDSDLLLLQNLCGDESRVFTETSESSIGVLVNYNFHALIGSDVQNWDEYEKCSFSDLRLPVSSFEQFCRLSSRDKVVINTLLNKKKSYSYNLHPVPKENVKLTFYEDINIIFGQKGTGKTQLIKSLHDEIIKNGMECVMYTGSEKDKDFSQLLSTDNMTRSCKKLNADNCSGEFEFLCNWKDTPVTKIEAYVNWYQTRHNSANKERMKITESQSISLSYATELQNMKNDKKVFNDAANSFKDIDLRQYLSESEITEFDNMILNISRKISGAVLGKFIQEKAITLSNYTIYKIKQIADKNTNTLSRPSETGFLQYARNHLLIKRSCKKILKEMDKSEVKEKNLLGKLEDKGNIYICQRYAFLDKDSRKDDFAIGISKLKKAKEKICKICDNAYSDNIAVELSSFAEAVRESDIENLDCFIGLTKFVVDEKETPYVPSSGEKGILVLQNVMKSQADAYLFDELELGMGNSYIDSTIRPQIMDLAKMHKTVVIATHNANLAVRTLPYMSVFRKYDNGNYKTYIGNPFYNILTNLLDEKDNLNWTVESMHTLEGGREAFYERKDIYESGNN